jgi:hypothetical protein
VPRSRGIGLPRLHREVRRVRGRPGDGRRRRDVREVGRGGVQRPVSEELLDRIQRRAALNLGERPAVPQAMRVDALLDSGLRREALAERPHVAVPERRASVTIAPAGTSSAADFFRTNRP